MPPPAGTACSPWTSSTTSSCTRRSSASSLVGGRAIRSSTSVRSGCRDARAVTSAAVELVETVVGLPHLELTLLRPRDSEALLDEEAFERDAYLPYWAELWPSGLALARTL